MPESKEHNEIKRKVVKSLEEWYGVSIGEYYDSGHKLDAYSVTLSGISVYVEVIWYHGKSHFLNDMLMLERSPAKIKLVIANSKIIQKEEYRNHYRKTVISQRQKGCYAHGTMINGEKYLIDDSYLYELKSIIDDLIDQRKEKHPEGSYFDGVLNKVVKSDTEKQIGYPSPNEFMPQSELIIAPRNETFDWFEKNDVNRWLVSTFCDINEIKGGKDYFDYKRKFGEYIKIYKSGIFHLVDNIRTVEENGGEHHIIYYRNIFLPIIEKIVKTIRIMKYYNIDETYSVCVRLYNVNHYGLNYRIRSPRSFSFPRGDNFYEEIYHFNPLLLYSEQKEVMKNIIEDIFKESNNLYVTDDDLERWLDYCISHSWSLGKHTYMNYVLEAIDISEFNLDFNRNMVIQ